MRKPTPLTELYRWHAAALEGREPVTTHEPQCGFFKRRLIKGGPFVAGRIFMDQPVDAETGELMGDEVMRCEVDGKPRDPTDEWTYLAGQPITEADYHYLMADALWCKAHAPQAPQANPTEIVRTRTIPPLF